MRISKPRLRKLSSSYGVSFTYIRIIKNKNIRQQEKKYLTMLLKLLNVGDIKSEASWQNVFKALHIQMYTQQSFKQFTSELT